jgi:hypothetical protein
MRTRYIAYDDTEFDTKEECLSYEIKHNNFIELLNLATALDSNGKEVIDPAFNLGIIFSIFLPTQEVANAFEALRKEEGYDTQAFLPGYYRYNDYTESWENVADEISKLTQIREDLMIAAIKTRS